MIGNAILESVALLFLMSIFYFGMSTASGFKIEVYPEEQSPFGIPKEDWVARWWNWSFSIGIGPDNQWDVKNDGCTLQREDSMVMLLDTAAGEFIENCTISQNDGILIPIWTGECNRGEEGCTEPHVDLKKKAREFDLGKVTGAVEVDKVAVAKLDVFDIDKIITVMENVSEISTKIFNVTVPENTHVPKNIQGTFPAAAHGWFVFLKPLPVGNHTIHYESTWSPRTDSPKDAGLVGKITYNLNVK